MREAMSHAGTIGFNALSLQRFEQVALSKKQRRHNAKSVKKESLSCFVEFTKVL